MYVLGAYCLRSLRRSMMNTRTITPEMTRVGTRVETRPEAELEVLLGSSSSWTTEFNSQYHAHE